MVGAEPSLSHYLRITRQAARIEAPVRQAPDHDLAALAERIWPTVAHVLADRRDDALASLDRAVSTHRSVSGPTAVWRGAQRTTGALLLVEHGLEYPARLLVDGTLQPSDDPAAPDVVDDAIDDLIEIVLGRRGRVEIVPDGTLAAHQGVALVCANRAPR